jgi:hypothetical protein
MPSSRSSMKTPCMSNSTGSSCLICASGNTLGWTIPGLIKSSRLITSPKPGTTVLPLGVGVSLFAVLVALVGAAVVGAVVPLATFCSVFVVSVVVGALPGTVAGSAWVVGAVVKVCEAVALVAAGVVADAEAVFTGLNGLVGFVTFVIDFTQLFDVVTQGCHTG